MRIHLYGLAVVSAVLMFALSARASIWNTPAPGQTCDTVWTPSLNYISYCVTPGAHDHVIVYFPGVFSTQTAWNDPDTQAVVNFINVSRLQQPTVVTIGIGPVDFLNGVLRISGLTDIEEVSRALVQILKQTGLGDPEAHPRTVDLLGQSMGGFNALQIFARHPDYFRKVALMCPAETRVSPFASVFDWIVNMQEEGAHWDDSIAFRAALRAYFGDAQQWDLESPMAYLARVPKIANPQPFLISTVLGDRFGFSLVEDNLQQLLQSRGHTVVRHQTSGVQHCYVDGNSLAQFLMQ